jgi:ubiquitin conjugation factor E4 A
MYIVLKYLWNSVQDPHRRKIRELAEEAEKTIEAANAPLFLRFVNLLMNDAIFLLDEGLSYMKQIKELERKRDARVEWNQEAQQMYHHVGRLGRFHNIMALETISSLAMITEDIKTIFCHDQLKERIAAMLNYFLKSLVGPSKSDFKVKDMNEFDSKPAEIVHDICKIYTHLAIKTNPKSESFCSAVADDGRSYSPELLPAAAAVLLKTHKNENGTLVLKIEKLAQKIERVGRENIENEIDVEQVPDEYLDPIMSTLMTDPVQLPSGYVLDRNTIARHLLSDQTDPFTRSPLNMDMVKPDVALKTKINEFITEYKLKRANNSATQE